jgi:hypothetical protein
MVSLEFGDSLRRVTQNAIVLGGFLSGKCRAWQTRMTWYHVLRRRVGLPLPSPPEVTIGRAPSDSLMFPSGGIGKMQCTLAFSLAISILLINERREALLSTTSFS